jgi:hypothetical protein
MAIGVVNDESKHQCHKSNEGGVGHRSLGHCGDAEHIKSEQLIDVGEGVPADLVSFLRRQLQADMDHQRDKERAGTEVSESVA